jgi:valyl-tRNA synthetase
VKPAYGSDEIDGHILEKTQQFFEELMKMLHPFMPFITEEIYHELSNREDDICIAQLSPIETGESAEILHYGKLLQECITSIRDTKIKAQLKPRDEIGLFVQTEIPAAYAQIGDILAKQVSATSIELTQESIPQTIPAVAGKEKFYIKSSTPIDTGNQKDELIKELEYLKGFLVSVEKKLGNERFVQNAKPEVVEIERRKKADAEKKIEMLQETLVSLN